MPKKKLIFEEIPEELYKPCPFCGARPERNDCIGCGYIQIICPSCGANISLTIAPGDSIRENEDELIRRWNRRAK